MQGILPWELPLNPDFIEVNGKVTVLRFFSAVPSCAEDDSAVRDFHRDVLSEFPTAVEGESSISVAVGIWRLGLIVFCGIVAAESALANHFPEFPRPWVEVDPRGRLYRRILSQIQPSYPSAADETGLRIVQRYFPEQDQV